MRHIVGPAHVSRPREASPSAGWHPPGIAGTSGASGRRWSGLRRQNERLAADLARIDQPTKPGSLGTDRLTVTCLTDLADSARLVT